MAQELQKKAMLVELSMGTWSGTVYDREASEELLEEKGAKGNRARVRKTIIDRRYLKAISGASEAIRRLHFLLTLPWDDKGSRLLPVAKYKDYQRLMDEAIERRAAAVRVFTEQYDEARQNARDELGELFREDDYETAAEVAARYYVEYEFGPVPDAKHFIADVGSREAARIRIAVTQQIEARLTAAVTSLYGRIAEAVGALADHIAPQGEGEKTRRLHGSVLERLREVVDATPALNLTGDRELTKLCGEIGAKLDGMDIEAFRPKAKGYNPAARAEAAAGMAEIRERLAGFLPAPKAEAEQAAA